MKRSERKALHRKGIYPPATAATFRRRRLGDPPGFYKRDIPPATVEERGWKRKGES